MKGRGNGREGGRGADGAQGDEVFVLGGGGTDGEDEDEGDEGEDASPPPAYQETGPDDSNAELGNVKRTSTTNTTDGMHDVMLSTGVESEDALPAQTVKTEKNVKRHRVRKGETVRSLGMLYNIDVRPSLLSPTLTPFRIPSDSAYSFLTFFWHFLSLCARACAAVSVSENQRVAVYEPYHPPRGLANAEGGVGSFVVV